MMHLRLTHKTPDCTGVIEARWTSYYEPGIYCYECGARRVIRREPLRSILIDQIEGTTPEPIGPPPIQPGRFWCRAHTDQPTRANGTGCRLCELERAR